MTHRAYERGSAAIRTQAQQRQRPAEFAMMDDYNRLPKHTPAPTPFGSVVISPWKTGFWFADPRTDFGFWYPTLAAAVRSWNVDLTGYDETRQQWTAEPRKPQN